MRSCEQGNENTIHTKIQEISLLDERLPAFQELDFINLLSQVIHYRRLIFSIVGQGMSRCFSVQNR
jgi:hypothetical protein